MGVGGGRDGGRAPRRQKLGGHSTDSIRLHTYFLMTITDVLQIIIIISLFSYQAI